MQKDGTFAEELTYCDGLDSDIVTATQCTVPLLTLQAAPFSLLLGDSIIATVTATNKYGESAQSDQGNGAVVLEIPDAPINLQDDVAVTTAYVIGFTWEDGTSFGGTSIIDYRI